MFRSRSDIFRLRTDKFRLRNDFVSPGGSQAVEIVGPRNVRFRSFVRFQGVTPAFFSRFLFRRPFSEPPVRPSLNLVSQNLSIARIRFQGKPKGESIVRQFEFRFHQRKPHDWRARNAPILAVQPKVAAVDVPSRRHVGNDEWH